MIRFIYRLRLSVRWRLFFLGVLIAYCLPLSCFALALRRAAPPEATHTPTPGTIKAVAPAASLTVEPTAPEVGALSRTATPPAALTPGATAFATLDPTWDYRQSVDLRAELCARLRVPPRTEAYASLCDITLPIEGNTAEPIIAYLGSIFTPGQTPRADIGALLGAYQVGADEYRVPVRSEHGREVSVRLTFTFDERGRFAGFDSEMEAGAVE